MFAFRSLRTRILLAMTGLVVIGFAVLTILAGQQISSGTINDYRERMIQQALLIARGLKEPVEHAFEGETSTLTLQDILVDFASQFDIEVALLQSNGRPWVGVDVPSILTPSAAPEVLAAINGQAIENTRLGPDGAQMVYAAAPIFEDGQLMAVVHMAAPLAAAQSAIWQRWLTLVAVFIIMTGLAVAISLWLSASLTKPIDELQDSALAVAQGDFSTRLPENRQDEIGQLSKTFNHMSAQVEEMIEEQRAFAANASHELRTPLTAIRLRSEALREGRLDEATAGRYVVEIDDEAARLGELVEDLILISRLDSGRLEMGREEIDFGRLAGSIAQEFSPALAEKGIDLQLNLPEGLPPVRASLNHLQVVFRNILSNSVKYSPPGGKITWTAAADGDCLCSQINDTGQGIAAEDLDHLFERFYRADKAHTREVQGIGLGLPLIKMIIEFYGGKITIDSPGVHEGSSVQVLWPFQPRKL